MFYFLFLFYFSTRFDNLSRKKKVSYILIEKWDIIKLYRINRIFFKLFELCCKKIHITIVFISIFFFFFYIIQIT